MHYTPASSRITTHRLPQGAQRTTSRFVSFYCCSGCLFRGVLKVLETTDRQTDRQIVVPSKRASSYESCRLLPAEHCARPTKFYCSADKSDKVERLSYLNLFVVRCNSLVILSDQRKDDDCCKDDVDLRGKVETIRGRTSISVKVLKLRRDEQESGCFFFIEGGYCTCGCVNSHQGLNLDFRLPWKGWALAHCCGSALFSMASGLPNTYLYLNRGCLLGCQNGAGCREKDLWPG